MRVKHKIEIREGEHVFALSDALKQIPDDAINPRFKFENELVGFGQSEHNQPYLVISWETE